MTKKDLLLLILIVCYLQVGDTFAQSGRQRPRTEPPPRPTPTKPSEPGKTETPTKSTNETSRPTKILVPAGAALIKEEHAGVTSRYLFKNGLTLVVREDHSVPIVGSAIYVKSGAASEPEGQAGIARVVARLVGETSQTVQANLRELRKNGAITEIETDFESTTFKLLGSSTKFGKLLEHQFSVVQNRAFSAEDVTRVAKLVSQEEKARLDDPLGYGQQRLLQTAFAQASVTTGSITKEQVQNFYDKHYTGTNIIVSVVGDVSPDQVRLLVQQFLGSLKVGSSDTKLAKAEVANESAFQYLDERSDLNQTVVSVGYRVPGLSDKDSAVFELLKAMLIKGRGSLFQQTIVDKSFASSVNANYLASNKGGLFVFQIQTVPERLVKAEEALFTQIESIRRLIASQGELQRAKTILEKDYYDQTLKLDDLAHQLAFWESRGGYKNYDTYLQRLKGITGEQVQQLAAQFFGLKSAIVHEFQPKNAPARLAGTDPIYTAERFQSFMAVLVPRINRDSVGKEEIVYAPETPVVKQGTARQEQATEGIFILGLIPQPVKDFSTLNGPKALVREDQSRPLLSVGFYFQGGRLIENDENRGITELMLRSILRGTQREVGTDIAFKLEQLGASVKIVNEADFFGFTLDVLSRNSEQALKTLIDLIEAPAFDKDQFAVEKAGLLASIKASLDDPKERPLELLDASLYGSHPYGSGRYGTEKSIEKLSEEDIASWYQKLMKRQFPLAVLVGDTDGSSLVGRLLARSFSRRELDKSLQIPNIPTKPTAKDRIEERERRQTILAVGLGGPDGRNNDRYAFEVVRQILAGVGGRMTSALLQENSFDLKVESEERLQQTRLSIYITASPEQEQKARAFVEEQIKRLTTELPSDEEIEQGKNRAAALAANSLRNHSERALTYARMTIFAQAAADVDLMAEKFFAVSKDDIRRVIQTYFTPDRLATGIVKGKQ